MKQQQWGLVAGLAATISMVAACNLNPPTKAVDAEGTIGSNNSGSRGGTVTPVKPTTPGGNLGGTTQTGDATIKGKVLDEAGKPVAGATVMSGTSKTITGADGSYTLMIKAGEAVNIKVIRDGFILRDSVIPVEVGQTLEVNSNLVAADSKVTRIAASAGGKAVSSDGKTELVFPAGALKGDADVRVTWLDPSENLSRPAAFTVQQVADTGKTGGTEDETAAPSGKAEPSVSALNASDLPGPLETKAYGDRKYFSPVAFANVTMSNELKPGETATLRMAVSPEVLDDMLRSGDLKESDLGQELYPCFSWDAGESSWDKPALSKVVKDDAGQYWFEYTVRASSMTPAVAQFQTLQVGDESGQARVELVVGGGRRVVDGTYTYGALIERSSNEAFDHKGLKDVTIKGGQDWTNTGGHYRAPGRTNLSRPDVKTTSYTGTNYAAAMGAATFDKWDREGVFRLAFPPGERFEINSPTVWGIRASEADRTGVTERAGQAYLTPDPSGRSNATQTQTIASTYVKPFFYHTDANLTIKLVDGSDPDGTSYEVIYTVDGAQKTANLTSSAKSLKLTLPRRADAKPQTWALKTLQSEAYVSDTKAVTTGLKVGESKTVEVKLVVRGAK
jgi:Carboxypeptidase regulatory-like domain